METELEWGSRRANELNQVLDEVVLGKHREIRLILAGIFSGGSVLLEDVPGVAKTRLVRAFAAATGLDFARIQFTPDLLPSDITGSSIFNPESRRFDFVPGPIFHHVLLADEINRASPKAQAALLEAMAEQQVSVDGTTYPLSEPFCVLATQNPIEFEGTYPLPEAQLDRFVAVAGLGYPGADDEWGMLVARLSRHNDDVSLEPVMNRDDFLRISRSLEQVFLSESVGHYIVEIVRATREHPGVEIGASPRGTLALGLLGRSWAFLEGRDFVLPDDIAEIAVPALAHRIRVRPESWVRGLRAHEVVGQSLMQVPAPVGDFLRS